jgi:hypothetical protein
MNGSIIVAGSREFTDYPFLETELDKILIERPIEIVSGGARGVDRMGERYAKAKGYRVKLFPADWDHFGKSAGYRRNKQMAEYADGLVAFWDYESKGTKHMINLAEFYKLPIHVVDIRERLYVQGRSIQRR